MAMSYEFMFFFANVVAVQLTVGEIFNVSLIFSERSWRAATILCQCTKILQTQLAQISRE